MLTDKSYTDAALVYNLLINSKIDKVSNKADAKSSIYNFIKDSIEATGEMEHNLIANDNFANINLVGYKNYINIGIEDENNNKYEFKLLTEKYGDQNYYGNLSNLKAYGNFTKNDVIEGFKSYHEKMIKYTAKIEKERKKSFYKDYNINGIKGILEDGIKRFIDVNSDILEGHTIQYINCDCMYNGLNYELEINEI